jgi:hypothetical protein
MCFNCRQRAQRTLQHSLPEARNQGKISRLRILRMISARWVPHRAGGVGSGCYVSPVLVPPASAEVGPSIGLNGK